MPQLTEDQVDDLVDKWHTGSSNQSLPAFLEFTQAEYEAWVMDACAIPDMDEPRYKKALSKL